MRGPYCAGCGQSHQEVRVPLWRWARGYVEDTFHVDSRLVRSLVALVRSPGLLTREYLEGRRSRYVRPFRLYLMASVLYFLLWALFPPVGAIHVGESSGPQKGLVFSIRSDRAPENELEARIQRFTRASPGTASERLARSLGGLLPRAMFVLLPAFALLLAALFPGRFYSEHFLFSVHLHAFAFLVLALQRMVRLPLLEGALGAWLAAYAFLSLRRMYGQGWVRTTFKFALLALGYLLLLSLAVAAASLVAMSEG